MIKFFLTCICLFIVFEFSLDAKTFALKENSLSREQEKTILVDYTTFEKKLNLEISDIIKKILQTNPSAAKYVYKNKQLILKEITDALHLGVKYDSNPDSFDTPVNAKEITNSYFSPVLIKNNKVAYIRLDNFNPELIQHLYDDLTAIMRYSRKPIGILLDLRNCMGNNQDAAIKALSIFCQPGKIVKDLELQDSIMFEKNIKLPIITIIGHKTLGTPEIFAVLLKKLTKTILYGESSAGAPFNFSVVNLDSGAKLKIPVIPEALSFIPPYPVKPDILFHKTYPQISYKDFYGKKENKSKDEAINRASEILLCLVALTSNNNAKK